MEILEAQTFTDSCFEEFRAMVLKLTGITIKANRKQMLQARIDKRMRALQIKSYEDYLELLKSSTLEHAAFIDHVTTNETYFYRTPRAWEYLTSQFLPDWHSKHPGETLRVWSAAASSGEEAHTMGILCQEFQDKNRNFQYQILGTDISQEIISYAIEGLYSGRSIDAFRKAKPELFEKYLVEKEGGFEVVPQIRKRIEFRTLNLFHAPPFLSHFHLVLLRNVMIYFQPLEQENALVQVYRAMKPDGILVIGESESLVQVKSDFEHVQPLIYRLKRKEAA